MIRILVSIFLLGLAGFARAEPPACAGKNLLDELLAKDPAAHREVMAEAGKTPNAEAVLWRIAGKDGAADSHLFGTVHVTDPRITTLPEKADKALSEAKIVALELKESADRKTMTGAIYKHVPLIGMPIGQTLWDVVPDEKEPLIKKHPQLPPGAAAAFAGFQPWVVAAALAMPMCEMARQQSGIPVLDQAIGTRALAQGAELLGLETVEEQLGIFAAMPMAQQVDYLIATAEAGPIIADYFETLIQLYGRREIGALLPLGKRLQPMDAKGLAIMAYVERNLVEKRNLVMRDRALQYVKRGGAFIAVGALHLPGDKGLVALLREAGYEVSPIE